MDNVFSFVRSATTRLTTSYLLVIMIMSLGFSAIFYNASIGELERQMPSRSLLGRMNDGNDAIVSQFFEDRLSEGRSHLLLNLLGLNILTLLGGAGLSYVLARRTLMPIEKAMESQSRFTLDASHELRTPLTAIQVENEVALRSKQLTVERARELLASNVEEVAKLRGLADGLLRLARDEAPPRELVAVNDIVEEAKHRVAQQAADRCVTVEYTENKLAVIAEMTAMAQVVTILLDNAIKYSAADTSITVEAVRQGSMVALSVADHGVGIQPEELDRIFDRFYRADQSRSRQHVEGYGLGLSIAHKLVTQLGGTITATSPPDQGAIFTVKLPLGKQAKKVTTPA